MKNFYKIACFTVLIGLMAQTALGQSQCLNAPTVTTDSVSGVSSSGATVHGQVSSDGGTRVRERGACYGTSTGPTVGNSRALSGFGTGSYSAAISGLSHSTQYYTRAYATNAVGTAYGNEVSFTTLVAIPQPCPGVSTVTDIDGNVYQGIQIGTQCWTQSNLKVSKYRNGDNIPTGLSNSAWQNTTSGAYAIYNNNPVNDGLYGKLYNHYAVTDSRGLCPTGWHVPSDGEWKVLTKYLDPTADTNSTSFTASTTAGGALKSTATQPTPGGWISPNTGATNSSGFTALPGGHRNFLGGFSLMTESGCWWSSSVSSGSLAWFRILDYDGPIHRFTFNRTYGFSVRCCRD
ncbi:MAG: hypothetical protein FJ350_05870 [Sphingomonadales bacterium]|nr:hypothetical protein [Sphingomonadales bacterium]